ncbi:copper resistance protein CopC [Caldalkalibacillus thermarum TA2.A1]|uniref:Copper resistance protein CopC n=1 Tax=Caldalkalibacillus thermarum (strain TA2.A1) TaxID=986075 RepID=F5L326_CALTT|nr:copper resistance protein CopC [Caldalkalibacillus thermarum]EGL84258.1 copper resistance protein CopC [Caldalkalibacillus thermarum TA2.A1]
MHITNNWNWSVKRSGLTFIFVLLAIMFFFFAPLSVDAHTTIEKSFPEAGDSLEESPSMIDIWFLDSVEIHSGSFKVTDQDGREFETGQPFVNEKDRRQVTVPIKEDLPPSRYTVRIDVIAPDGHPLTESYQFEVEEPEISEEDMFRDLRLEKSNPEDGVILSSSPDKIELWTTQPAEITAFGLFDDKDEVVRTSEPLVDPENPKHFIIEVEEELNKGTYTINWYAQIGDKSKNGIFYFAIDEVTSLVSAERGSTGLPSLSFGSVGGKQWAHWLAFLGLLTLFGGTWFDVVIAKKKGNQTRWKKVTLYLYGLSMLGLFLLLIERRVEFSHLIWTDFISLRFTWLTGLQMVLLTVAYWFVRKWNKPYLILLGLTVLLWTLTGHSASLRYGGVLGVGVDALHLLGVSIWFGGLFALFIMTPKEEAVSWLKEAGKSFSRWAFWSMIIIILTGIWMTLEYVPTFTLESLLASEWGTMLWVKTVLVIGIIVLAYGQRRSIKRMSSTRVRSFFTRFKMELIFGALILMAAAVLIDLEPSAAEQGVYPQKAVQGDMEVTVEIDPFQIGRNDITIRFENEPELKQVKASFFMFPSWRMENNAFPLGDGEYRLTGNFLHGAGTIYMEVEAIQANGETSIFPFRIQVPGDMPESLREYAR